MSYILFYDQYTPLFETGDERLIKETFQGIFQKLVLGHRINRGKRKEFIKTVGHYVNSNSKKIRKWAYHCACFYQDDYVIQSIIKQLKTETNSDNIMWALIALSVKYDGYEELKAIAGSRHEEFVHKISKNYIEDAMLLFGGMVKLNPATILMSNNVADLLALTKIYAYNNLVNGKYPEVNESIIHELETNDDPDVREYAFWALHLGGNLKGTSLLEEDPVVEVQKWQIVNQISQNNIDFNVSALKPLACCPQGIHIERKTGILKGLFSIPYNDNYVSLLASWFDLENHDSILYSLLDYFIKFCNDNRNDGTFLDILKDSITDDRFYLYLIKKIPNEPQSGLQVIFSLDSYSIEFNEKGPTIMTMIKNEVHGSNIAIATAVDKSTAKATTLTSDSEKDKLAELIQKVRDEMGDDLSDEEKETIDEGLSAIEEEAAKEKPKKTVVNTLLNSIKAIARSTELIAAVVTLSDFITKTFG